MTPDTSKIMLEEMRHAFDTIHASVQKYNNKTFMEFGAEITFLLFYLSSNEIIDLKATFANMQCGWYIFAMLAIIAFIASAIFFIIALSIGRWSIPPHNDVLLNKNQYQQMYEKELSDELIAEYSHDISYCIKKVHKIKILSDIGLYILVFGIVCLLIIKFFGL